MGCSLGQMAAFCQFTTGAAKPTRPLSCGSAHGRVLVCWHMDDVIFVWVLDSRTCMPGREERPHAHRAEQGSAHRTATYFFSYMGDGPAVHLAVLKFPMPQRTRFVSHTQPSWRHGHVRGARGGAIPRSSALWFHKRTPLKASRLGDQKKAIWGRFSERGGAGGASCFFSMCL